MSDLAQAFLERWTQENVTAVNAEEDGEAERLAEACKAAGLEEGFTEDELKEAVALSSDDESSDLIAYMQAALELAPGADEEVDEDDYGDGDDE